MRYRIDRKMFSVITDNKIKCECGHTQLLVRKDRVICSHCGHWIYKNEDAKKKYDAMHFKYKLKELKNVLNYN